MEADRGGVGAPVVTGTRASGYVCREQTQRIPFGHERVLERVARRLNHPEPFHDAPRAHVPGGGDADDLVEAEPIEPLPNDGASGLRGIAPSPVLEGETPRDLDAIEKEALRR
jgi:hypothetical protein